MENFFPRVHSLPPGRNHASTGEPTHSPRQLIEPIRTINSTQRRRSTPATNHHSENVINNSSNGIKFVFAVIMSSSPAPLLRTRRPCRLPCFAVVSSFGWRSSPFCPRTGAGRRPRPPLPAAWPPSRRTLFGGARPQTTRLAVGSLPKPCCGDKKREQNRTGKSVHSTANVASREQRGCFNFRGGYV